MKKEYRWLLFMFVAVCTVRLIIAFSIPTLTYESYFHLRHVEEITATGKPAYADDLSYSGRTLLFLPFFHYFMAFFDLFLPLEFVAKIIPNLLLASLMIIVYFLSKKITTNETAPLLSAFIAGFLPVLFSTNAFIPETLFLPLTFAAIYSFFSIKDKNYLYAYLFFFLALSLTSSATFLLIIGFGIYFLLSIIEKKKIQQEEIEVIVCSLFLFLWIQFLFFKDLLREEGVSFIWQNVPPQIIQEYFPAVSVIQALILVSVIPFLAGVFIVYRSLFQLKNEKAFLLISFVISTTVLAWLRLIEFRLSLAFFSVILAILFALFYQELQHFITRTRVSQHHRSISLLLIVILALTIIPPAITAAWQQDVPSAEEVAAFRWLRENTPENAKVLALLEEGHLVTYYGKRKNVMDNKFALINNIDERFTDFSTLFTTRFQTQAIDLMDKYNIDYIIFTPAAQKKYQQSNIKYHSIDCFDRVYTAETRVYRVKCSLTEIKRISN